MTAQGQACGISYTLCSARLPLRAPSCRADCPISIEHTYVNTPVCKTAYLQANTSKYRAQLPALYGELEVVTSRKLVNTEQGLQVGGGSGSG